MLKDLYSDNLITVAGAVKAILQEDRRAKENLVPLWRKCVAFANGDQIASAAIGQAVTTNQSERMQTPYSRSFAYQTDEISPCVRTMVSYMTKQKPSVEVYSEDKSENGRAVARVAVQVSDAKYDIDNEQEISRLSAYWSVVTGTVFRKDYWIDDYTPVQLTDELGQVTEIIVPAGKNAVSVLSPFQFITDYSYTDFKKLPFVGDMYVADVDWCKQVYGKDEKGFTGEVFNISEDSNIGDSLSAFEEIKFASSYTGGRSSYRAGKNKCLVVELYAEPTKDFPKGRQIIVAGGVVVYLDESRYYLSSEPTMWHPYSMYGFEPYIGRLLHRGAVEQVLTDQMRINEINGAILENANTMAKPNLAALKGTVNRGVLNGSGCNLYEYEFNPLAPNAKIDVLEGAPLPSQFFEEKQRLIDGIARRLGTNFIMQGNTPTGVTAAAALQLLFDNATGQMADKMNAWTTYHEHGFTKKLRLIHKYNTMPDQDLIKYIRTLAPDSTSQEIESFIGSESLSDGIVVKIEASSQLPKSEAVKQEAYKSLMASPAFGPMIGDPSPKGENIRRQLLKAIGVDPLNTDTSVDFEKAKWENERMLRGEEPFFDEDDDHQVHIGCHTSQKKDPKILERPDAMEIIAACDAHLAMHKEAMAMSQGINSEQAVGDNGPQFGMPDSQQMGTDQGAQPLAA